MSARVELEKAVVESLEKEYSELSDSWHAIDRKAQGAVSIASVLVAGLFALVRLSEVPRRPTTQWLLADALLCLLASIGAAIGALWVREVLARPGGGLTARLVDDLGGEDGEEEVDESRVVGFYYDLRTAWVETNKALTAANRSKSTALEWSQGLLAAALIVAGALTALALFD